MAVLTAMVFLGAFLLFSMEPLAGRLLVPFMGGAVHVWLICLLFFQIMLLVGYLYGHLLVRRARGWHLALLVLPLVNLPFRISSETAPDAPVLGLLSVLTAHLSLPFAVLSTTVVTAQLWLTRSEACGPADPYPLYGASNAGSLLALLAYPLLIEPFLGLRMQGLLWTGGYVLYLALAVASWLLLQPDLKAAGAAGTADRTMGAKEKISRRRFLFWILLSGLPSAFLLTVTNVIAVEVGSFPMVWVLPLAAYLGSFVVIFRKEGKAPGFLVRFWPEILLAGLLLYLMPAFNYLILVGHLFILLALCLVVHGELYRDRPDASGLTHFYLAVALGGGIGGAAVSLGAPLIFNNLHEYPLILVTLGLVLAWCHRREFRLPSSRPIPGSRLAILLALCGLIAFGSWSILTTPETFRLRNYYGVSRVVDTPAAEETPAGIRTLIHGTTMHGIQFLDEKNRRRATLYYQPERGLAESFAAVPKPRRIGAVGLGAGTVSAYLEPGDRLTYYEIDADIERIARSWFTFIGDSAGEIRVVIGDGRLSLQKEAGSTEKYDLLLVDAFSGDGIPTHLLTAEAIRIYLERLTERGILLFHLSNRYYDLRPVLKAAAANLALHGAVKTVISSRRPDHYRITTVYGMLVRDQAGLTPFARYGWVPFSDADGLMKCRPWTDDYVNILAPLWAKLAPFAAP